jgi:cytochrome P450
MMRTTLKTVKLPNNIEVPKGTMLAVSTERLWDPETHLDPEKFSPERYLAMREDPALHSFASHVATSENNLVFGHGQWSCPGRFFASNELKIILCHIILKYDLKFSAPVEQPIIKYMYHRIPNPNVEVMVRRREEELNVDELQ